MPEETPPEPPENPPASKQDEGKTFTQADVDRIVADRLKRAESKFADYDDLKAKAGKLDEIEAANKSEADKLREELDQLKAANSEATTKALRAEVAMSKGLTAAQAKRLVGTTPEELEADADEILEAFKPADGNKPPSGRPAPDLQGGTDPTVPTDPDIGKIVDEIPRH